MRLNLDFVALILIVNNIKNIYNTCLLINGCHLGNDTGLKTPPLTFLVQTRCYELMLMLMLAVAWPTTAAVTCFS